MRRALAAAALALAPLLVAGVANAQSRPDLEKARAAYLARNYKEAEERLRALVDPATNKDRALLSQARMNLAAVLLAQGKKDEASDVFEKLILDDSTFEPDPLGFPTEVLNTFIDARAGLHDKIKLAAQESARREQERKAREEALSRAREKRQRDIEKMASEEKITVKNQRLIAFIPFGAGQFQNKQAWLGWLFLGAESALVVASAVTIPMYAYARRRADEEAPRDVDRKAEQYKDRASDIQAANLAIVGSFTVLALAGIAQANIAFVPETHEVKKRELPKLDAVSKLRPIVSPLGGESGTGMYFGVTGATF